VQATSGHVKRFLGAWCSTPPRALRPLANGAHDQGLYRPYRTRPADRSLVGEDRSARGLRDQTGPKPTGTRWVHTEPADSGVQRIRAVTTGPKEPQVRPPSAAAIRQPFKRRARVRVSAPKAAMACQGFARDDPLACHARPCVASSSDRSTCGNLVGGAVRCGRSEGTARPWHARGQAVNAS
jgi:hypothetical protein